MLENLIKWVKEGRGLFITRKNDKLHVFLKRPNERLRLFVLNNDIFASVMAASTKTRVPGVFRLPFAEIWVLDKDDMDRFVKNGEVWEVVPEEDWLDE